MAVRMAVENEHVIADVVEATEFPALSQRFRVMSVPKIVINDSTEFVGALPENRYIKEVMKAVGNGEA
jgi:thioredoxin-related protein